MEELIFQQFEKIRSTTKTLTNSVESTNHSRWIADWNSVATGNRLEDVLTDFWYREDQDGRETRVYPGLVGLNRQQITYAYEINLAKDAFRKTIQDLKQSDNDNWREIQGKLARRYNSLNDSLARQGLSRLHLKQVFRHLPLVVNRPDKVGFSWYTSGRSIKKISTQEAYKLLCKLNTESTHIKIQLERLAALKNNEPLARVQKQAPLLRANLVFADSARKSMNVSLPLFYPNEGKSALPDFNIPPLTPPSARNRLVRSDNKIEDEPYLPSIRVHRYSTKESDMFF